MHRKQRPAIRETSQAAGRAIAPRQPAPQPHQVRLLADAKGEPRRTKAPPPSPRAKLPSRARDCLRRRRANFTEDVVEDSDPCRMPSLGVLDAESARWIEELHASGAVGEQARQRLHAMLYRVARAEAFRRRDRLPAEVQGDLADLCLQAADDSTLAVLGKLDQFRGASRFTSWAYKFAVLEISVRLRRRVWAHRQVPLGDEAWELLPDPAPGASEILEERELLAAVREAALATLTKHQRAIFAAAVFEEVPIDVIAERLGSTRGAIYKTLHDARCKLRRALSASGMLGEHT
jgi:RNA polymerase sigma-70 factor (ECF subfamily)